MKHSVILTRTDFNDPDALIYKLNAIQPEDIIIRLNHPHDMKIYEDVLIADSLNRLFPMFKVFSNGALIMSSMISQAGQFIEGRLVCVLEAKVDSEYLDNYIDIALAELDFEKQPWWFWVSSSAADFAKDDSPGVRLLSRIRSRFVRPAFPMLGISSTEHSMSILNNSKFLLRLEESAESSFLFSDYENKSAEEIMELVSRLEQYERQIVFSNIDLAMKAIAPEAESGTKYEVLFDNSSIWADKNMSEHVGILDHGEILILTDIMGKVGRTSEGYYVHMSKVHKISDDS